MSFRYRVAWVCLLATLAVFVPYFWVAFGLAAGGRLYPGAALGLLIAASVAAVLLYGVPVALLAAWARDEREDERDRAIAARATRVAYFVLLASLFLMAMGLVALGSSGGGSAERPWFTPALGAQLVLLPFVIAELVRFAVEVAGHARGA
jgi:hypothetical protein